MCNAIAEYEGGPGDLNHINNNPGNLRSSGLQSGTNKGFAVFPTWDRGMAALRQLLYSAATNMSKSYRPEMTLVQFFAVYSPSADHNDPNAYAHFVAQKMGVAPSWQIKNLA